MAQSIQILAEALRAAREKKSLSQRALGGLLGIPQGRLSRIETGATDLRASSLLEIARALDLEVMLVPRQLVPAVSALTREFGKPGGVSESLPPAYSLDHEDDDV